MSVNRAHKLAGAFVLALAASASASSAVAYDRPGTFELISVSSRGVQGNGPSGADECSRIDPPAVSASGRFVAFVSTARNLSGADPNGPGPDVFVRDRKKGTTEIVSVSDTGAIPLLESLPGSLCGPLGSYRPAISGSGRFVAFVSDAPTLVPGDANHLPDVFVRDRKVGRTWMISVASDGTASDGTSGSPSISADGRFVVFESSASTLVDEPVDCTVILIIRENCSRQIYLHDMRTRRTSLVSVNDDGEAADYDAGYPSLSPDGRYLAFTSHASNLAANDTSICPTAPRRNCRDVFLRDLQKKTTELISASIDGRSGNNDSYLFEGAEPVISRAGRYVTFESSASNLVPNDAGGTDQFVRDRKRGRTDRVSVTSSGVGLRGGNLGTMSANGRYVAFGGYVDQPESSSVGLRVHDRITGATDAYALPPEGTVTNFFLGSIERSGRYVSFVSDDATLVPDDENSTWDIFVLDRGSRLATRHATAKVERRRSIARSGSAGRNDRLEAGTLEGALVAHRPKLGDLFVRIDVASLPFRPGVGGDPSVVYGLRFLADGIPYEVRVQSDPLSARSPGGGEFRLLHCASGDRCEIVTELDGGYGTVGETVVFSIPLEDLGASRTLEIDRLTAFSALGLPHGGRWLPIDQLAFRSGLTT